MIITEPKWKSWIVETKQPLFTPDQCRQVIECGRRQKPQKAQVGGKRPGGGLDTKKRVSDAKLSVLFGIVGEPNEANVFNTLKAVKGG